MSLLVAMLVLALIFPALTAPDVLSQQPAAVPVATSPQTLGDLMALFHVDEIPADFVLAIDTSTSMADPPDAPYPHVLSAGRRFVGALGPEDRVTIITFDRVPSLIFAHTLDSAAERAAAVAALPPTPLGDATDIGGGLSAVLDALENPLASAIEIVLFVTDGKHNPGVGSRYASSIGPAWDRLRMRAERLASAHRLRVFGAGLAHEGRTDVALLEQVFADTEIASLPTDQLASFFAEVGLKARLEKLRTRMGPELANGGIRLRPLSARLPSAPNIVPIEISSSLPTLPVAISITALRAEVRGRGGVTVIPASVVGARRVLIPARGDVRLNVRLTWPPQGRGIHLFHHADREQLTLRFDLDTTALPADVIRRQVGFDPHVPVVGSTVQVGFVRSSGWAWWLLISAVAALLMLLLGLAWVGRRLGRREHVRAWFEVERASVVGERGRLDLGSARVVRLPSRNGGNGIASVQHHDDATFEVFTKRGRRGITFIRPIGGQLRVGARGHLDVVAGERVLHTGNVVEAGEFRAVFYQG